MKSIIALLSIVILSSVVTAAPPRQRAVPVQVYRIQNQGHQAPNIRPFRNSNQQAARNAPVVLVERHHPVVRSPPVYRQIDYSGIPDENGNYPDVNGYYPDDNGFYPDANGNYPDENGRYPDQNGFYAARYAVLIRQAY